MTKRASNSQNSQGCPQVPAFIRRSGTLVARIEASLPACMLNMLVRTLLDTVSLNPRQRAFYKTLMPDLVSAVDGPFMTEARPIRERLAEIASGVARYAITRNGIAKDPLPVLLGVMFWMEPVVDGHIALPHQGPALPRVYQLLCQEVLHMLAVERNAEDILLCADMGDCIVPVIQQRLEGLGFFIGATSDAAEAVAA
ncbi:hypothetical protein J2847_005840 [Azospirillum agricola]|uniref:hypothetical protein n=1 Tax=Azospirillum agricola TaxID=1720247 RepID=UPI001AE81505|nr:hypothetical protein [Azospirillum agricola]MBP2232511.1 hypothetical protein [Azospirillum agricola]